MPPIVPELPEQPDEQAIGTAIDDVLGAASDLVDAAQEATEKAGERAGVLLADIARDTHANAEKIRGQTWTEQPMETETNEADSRPAGLVAQDAGQPASTPTHAVVPPAAAARAPRRSARRFPIFRGRRGAASG